jgi:hypothetical protein
MADEVMGAVLASSRENTMKAYKAMRQKLIEKAELMGDPWTAEDIGRALWTHSIICLGGLNPLKLVPAEDFAGAESEDVVGPTLKKARSRRNKRYTYYCQVIDQKTKYLSFTRTTYKADMSLINISRCFR